MPRIHTLDLHFQDTPEAIAAYLIPHADGGLLVETGPGSTTDALVEGLSAHGLTPNDITDVLLTHIHLDHGGAAGWLAAHGARIHVHEVGAPHLIRPHKLLKSATRIYGDDMDRLWGEMRPVPEEQVHALSDGDTVRVGPHAFTAYSTPGHAYHHMAYVIDGCCFSGDVGGVRLPGAAHVSPPLPPPEIRLDLWKASIQTLRGLDLDEIAPTHFGRYTDVAAHLDSLEASVEAADAWIETALADDPDDETLERRVSNWLEERARADGVTDAQWARYETANPSWMAAAGLRRYAAYAASH
ncbi:MBL fold metallo-hydrolase [Salisaeta longa]|uniref:MBL fold metallo-hydrolase n=1 Tax=Salisaeta longa TaxID=503170 RepID=UPI0003B36095|nr:MBL fold metallo-hydrolase [Salisaeta longa]